MALTTDPWPIRQAQLEAEGWVFYETRRYDPTLIRAYSTKFLTGSAANRRKANRAMWLLLERTTANPADAWRGTIRSGAASVLDPWVAGAAMPPDDADWRLGGIGHYSLDGMEVNPLVAQELDAARDAPVATFTALYGNCSDPDTALAAIRDLFSRLSVPA